jgi:hypothetical protein
MSTCTYTPGTDSIDITAPGGIEALLAFHRRTFGDARMEASGDDGDKGDGGDKGSGEPKLNEHGFPDATPWKDMPPDQQVAYWRHQSRKHEDRASSTADYDAIKTERDQLKAKHQTADEKAIEDATKAAADTAAAAERGKLAPRLVQAEFKALVAGRIPAARLEAILAPLDHTKFLTGDGEVDTDKVQQYVDGLAPDGKKWPDMGQGHRGSSGKTTGVGAGRSLYEDRRPKSAAKN